MGTYTYAKFEEGWQPVQMMQTIETVNTINGYSYTVHMYICIGLYTPPPSGPVIEWRSLQTFICDNCVELFSFCLLQHSHSILWVHIQRCAKSCATWS